MKCEGCNAETEGYSLFDYCENCSKNLCASCMSKRTCKEAEDRRHHPDEADEEDGE